MVDSPTRGQIASVVKAVIARAEDQRKPPGRFAWHRRFNLGIDSTLEAAERRLLPQNMSGDRELDLAVELAVAWLQAQKMPDGSVERASCLFRAQELIDMIG